MPKDIPAEAYDELGFIDMLEKMDRDSPSDDIRTTLNGFGTWDAIHLNGGKTIHGDILELGLSIQRGSTIIVEQKAGLFNLLTGPKTIINGNIVITDQKGIFASIVGEKGNSTIPWANIEKIELSNPKEEWG